MSSACVCHIPNEICWYCEALKARHERWEYEKGVAEIHSQLSDALRVLSWYAEEVNYIQGRHEGGVFFTCIEDDKGKRAKELLDKHGQVLNIKFREVEKP